MALTLNQKTSTPKRSLVLSSSAPNQKTSALCLSAPTTILKPQSLPGEGVSYIPGEEGFSCIPGVGCKYLESCWHKDEPNSPTQPISKAELRSYFNNFEKEPTPAQPTNANPQSLLSQQLLKHQQQQNISKRLCAIGRAGPQAHLMQTLFRLRYV